MWSSALKWYRNSETFSSINSIEKSSHNEFFLRFFIPLAAPERECYVFWGIKHCGLWLLFVYRFVRGNSSSVTWSSCPSINWMSKQLGIRYCFCFFQVALSLALFFTSSPNQKKSNTVEANLGPNVRSRSRLNHLAITCQEIAFEFTWVQIEPTNINIKKYSTLILTLGSTDIVKYWPNVFLSTGTSSMLSTFSKFNYNEQVTVVEKNQYSCVHLFKWKCIKNELQSPRKW